MSSKIPIRVPDGQLLDRTLISALSCLSAYAQGALATEIRKRVQVLAGRIAATRQLGT